mgnify:CR=1 FL=1
MLPLTIDNEQLLNQEAPVVTNLEELKILANNYERLSGKVVTIQGITIRRNICDLFHKITFYGKLKLICFNNCNIRSDSIPVFRDISCSFAVNNCNLTADTAEDILRSLDPYAAVDADLSNNNLGGEGFDQLLKYIKDVVSAGIQGFSSLNLTNNGINEKDIEDLKEFIKTENYSDITT